MPYMHNRTAPVVAALILLFAVASAQTLSAQQGPASAGWAPIMAGLHIGYDDSSNGEMVGAQIRIPVLRNGRLELMGSGDVTFLTRLKEYQGNLELVFLPGGSGLYVGGGLGYRNTIFGVDPLQPRETRRGYTAVAGVKAGSGTFGSQLELRWTFLPDSSFDPRSITFGVNFPLWGRRGGGS